MMIRYMIDQLATVERVSLIPAALACSTQWGLTRNSEMVFSGSSQQGVSDVGWYAIGGILKHATTLAALALATQQFSPTVEYRWLRMVSPRDPDAICNVIFGSHNPRSRAIEFRGTPSQFNPYIHLAAVMMAMLDGIQNKYPGMVSSEVGSGRDALSVAGGEGGIPDPRRLSQSLIEDRDFLLYGDVFSEGLLDLLTEFLALDH
jgi:glutamine synthetase